MHTHIVCVSGVCEDGGIGREKRRVELTRGRDEKPIERIGKDRARNEAGIDRDTSRQLRKPNSGLIQRRLNPLLGGLGEPQTTGGVQGHDLE